MKLAALLFLTLSVPAHAADVLYIYSTRDCTGPVAAIIPIATANVNCHDINMSDTTWQGSVRAQGEITCAKLSSSKTVEDLCKAYNGR